MLVKFAIIFICKFTNYSKRSGLDEIEGYVYINIYPYIHMQEENLFSSVRSF